MCGFDPHSIPDLNFFSMKNILGLAIIVLVYEELAIATAYESLMTWA